MTKLTYGRLCELAQRHGVTITENVRAFVREVEQTDAAQAAAEPIAWESTTLGYRKYLTQARYERLGERFRKWYKPYRCSACASREASASNIKAMVDRFLGWRLPDDFGPDCGITFTPLGHPNGWPVGTNLFTAVQAEAMFRHALGVSGEPAHAECPQPLDATEAAEREHLGCAHCETGIYGRHARAYVQPVLWWNGIRKGEAGDFVGPSFSDKKDTNHDIPLVSAVNPCNYTHPEASAPGLSDEVDRQNAGFDRCFEALGFPANHGFERSWSSLVLEIQRALTRASADTAQVEDELSTKDFQSSSELERCPFCGGKACMKEVLDGDRVVGYRAHCANFWCTGWQPCLTSQTPEVAASVWNKRHGAATLAEPSGGTLDTYPARLLHESDKSLAWRVDSWHERHPQAVQQQAKPPEQASEADDKPTEQQAWPSDPTGLIARLRIHAEDRANTAFARSSMREAAGVLEDRQAEASTYERGQQLAVFLRLAEVVQADSKRTRDRYPAQSERADQLAAFMKTACKWAAQSGPREAEQRIADLEGEVTDLVNQLRGKIPGQQAGMASKPWDAAAHDVLAERTRQITHEGATPLVDDGYTNSQLALAAATYVLAGLGWEEKEIVGRYWPWDMRWWKPTTPRRNLVKAGALILAEIERLDRAAATQQESTK